MPPLARVVAVLILVLIGLLSFHDVGGLDEGFHLRAGNYILEGRGWPQTDPFTYTLRDHPYIDTSWGYQVLLALTQRWLDAPGMVAFNTLLVLCTAILVYRTTRLRAVSPLLLLFAGAAAGVASHLRFEIRPEILSYLLLAATLHVLARHAEGLRSPLWSLPLILLIWANCHSLFVLGWAAIGCCLIGRILRERRFDRRLGVFALLALATPFINPYGVQGVLFPLGLLSRFHQGNPFARSIDELLSPLSPSLASRFTFFPIWPIYAYRILAILSVIGLWGLVRARMWSAILLWAIFLPLSAVATRNMPLLAVACFPGLVWGFPAGLIHRTQASLGRVHAKASRAVFIGLAAVLAALSLRVVTNAYYIDYRQDQRLGCGWNRGTLPLDAGAYLRRVRPPGRMLNHLNFGGALMWAQPSPVFIDSRLEVAGEDFYKEYRQTMSSVEGLEAAVSKYGIEWIVYPHMSSPRLTNRLANDPRWRLTYLDPLSAIFVRVGSPSDRVCDPVVNAPPIQQPPPIESLPGLGGRPRLSGVRRWLEGFCYRQTFPSSEYNRALFHMSRDELAAAEALLARAIDVSDGAYIECYRSLGPLLMLSGRRELARRCFEIVLEEYPGDEQSLQSVRSLAAQQG